MYVLFQVEENLVSFCRKNNSLNVGFEGFSPAFGETLTQSCGCARVLTKAAGMARCYRKDTGKVDEDYEEG